MLLTTGHLRM